MDDNGKITTLRIERWDPDQVVAVEMNGGRRWTALEQIQEGRVKHPRSDIFMVLFQRIMDSNEETYASKSKQLWVYPTMSGEPNFGEAGEWMTDAEKAWCREENARIQTTAAKHPEYKVFLR